MKILKRTRLLILCLVIITPKGSFAGSLNMNIDTTTDSHQLKLHTLFLTTQNIIASIKATSGTLTLSNGLIIGSGHTTPSSSTAATIGGGEKNTINGNHAGIGGGISNTAKGKNSIIGGGTSNTATGENAVVIGGTNNTAQKDGTILGGTNNEASSYGIILGGESNKADQNSIAMGRNSKATDNAFAWNATATGKSARIDTDNGMLIGTETPIQGVKLVVSGAIKVTGNTSASGQAGEMKVVNGCFYAFDGEYWHIVSTGSNCTRNPSNLAKTCVFGSVQLQAGDVVEGYNTGAATDCNSHKATVTCCKDGTLKTNCSGGSTGYTYPYCY